MHADPKLLWETFIRPEPFGSYLVTVIEDEGIAPISEPRRARGIGDLRTFLKCLPPGWKLMFDLVTDWTRSEDGWSLLFNLLANGKTLVIWVDSRRADFLACLEKLRLATEGNQS